MKFPRTNKPLRIGVFRSAKQAELVVQQFRAAGFRPEELAVFCADKLHEQDFSDVNTFEKPGADAPRSIATGSLIGATIGGLVLAGTAATTGGVSLLVAGAASIAAGALVGSFAGLMLDRGLEPDLADYYDQAVRAGRILVAVEVHGENASVRLQQAERIFCDAGAEPVALPETHTFQNS